MSAHRPTARILILLAFIGVSFTACLSDAAEPTIDLSSTPLPGTAIAVPTPSPSPTVEPTPSVAPWLLALLEPGPEGPQSPVAFFRDGPDLRVIEGDLSVQQVTEERRIREVATVPGTSSAAVVVIDSSGGRETEEIRIIDKDGDESEPIYGPEIVSAPAGNPGVASLAWAPNGETLAIVREDGSILLAGRDRETEPLPGVLDPQDILQISWSPASDALLILLRNDAGAGLVRIAPLESDGYFDILPLRSFGAAAWLPGSSRIVVVEDRAAGFNPNAGSLFTIQPDGTNRELLISAGEFGPAVQIGRILPSPDGSQLAFTVETPGVDGEMRFQSLRLLEIATGINRTIEIATGRSVTDLWWFEGRLGWRAVESDESGVYSGVEPFSIETFDVESGETALIYSSSGS